MTLFVLSTPIGHLDDLSPRAQEILKAADLIAAEDTRQTGKLLTHCGLRRPLARYDDHVHGRTAPRLLERLARGETIALVSDAGTPGVSDPGQRLVAEALAAGHKVVPVPGPSAVLTALVGSGLPSDQFTFLGFLSRRSGRLKKELAAAGSDRTLVLYESVFRLGKTLEAAREIFGDIPVAVGRELTKVHEEFLRGTAGEVLEQLKAHKSLKGEAVLVLAPQLTKGKQHV